MCRRPDRKMAGAGRNPALKQPLLFTAITTRLREAAIRPWKSWSAPSAFRLLCDLTKRKTRVSGGSTERLHVPKSGCAGNRMGKWPRFVEIRRRSSRHFSRRLHTNRQRPTFDEIEGRSVGAARGNYDRLIERYGRAHGGTRSATRVSPFCRPIAILLTRHGADHAHDRGEGGQPAAIFLFDGDSY